MMASRTIVSLQYLRAAAALMVLFHHGWDQLPWLKERFSDFCQSGVDLFFVISGFIMVFVTSQRPMDAASFIRMRLIRVVPLYWIATIAASLLLLTLPSLFQLNELTVGHFVLSMLFVAHPSPAAPWSASPIIKLGWTLEYEMFFYAVFAGAIVLSPSRRVLISALTLAAVTATGFTSLSDTSLVAAFYTNSILIEFVFGMIVASLFSSGTLKSIGPSLAGLLMTSGAVGLWVGGHYDPAFRAALFGVPAAMIVTGLIAIEIAGKLPKSPPLLLLGNASYSIYLVHLFPLAIFRTAWSRLHFSTQGYGPALLFVAICVLIGSLAGIAAYARIERPLLEFLRGLARSEGPRQHHSLPRPVERPFLVRADEVAKASVERQ